MAGIKEHLAKSADEVMRMNKKELSRALQEMSKAANRRLDAIARSGNTDAFAYDKTMRGKGRFTGSRGKTLNQMRTEYKRAIQFLRDKTSTTTGWKKFIAETRERIDPKYQLPAFDTPEGRRAYWQAYNRYMERHPSARQDSKRKQKQIRRIMQKHQNASADDLDKEIEKRLRSVYEKEQDVRAEPDRQDNTDRSSDFYDIWAGVDGGSKDRN